MDDAAAMIPATILQSARTRRRIIVDVRVPIVVVVAAAAVEEEDSPSAQELLRRVSSEVDASDRMFLFPLIPIVHCTTFVQLFCLPLKCFYFILI